jgi:hypothetical protein
MLHNWFLSPCFTDFFSPVQSVFYKYSSVRVLQHASIEGLHKIEDADVKDDVKMAWYAHVWICHANAPTNIFIQKREDSYQLFTCAIANRTEQNKDSNW